MINKKKNFNGNLVSLSLTAQDTTEIVAKIREYIDLLKGKWDSQGVSNNSWWKIGYDYLSKATGFLTGSVDDLVKFVEDLIPGGEDKKATVLAIAEKLFDYIVVQASPFWLTPFIPIIRQIVINVIVSNAIEFIVSKYNEGTWLNPVKE